MATPSKALPTNDEIAAGQCPGCGYPALLSGCNTCPGCGLAYDLRQTASTRSRPRRVSEWLLYTAISATVTTIGYSAVAFFVIRGIDELFIAQVFGAVFVSMFQAVILCATVLRPRLTAERFVVVLATHIGLMLLLAPFVQATVFVYALAAWAMGW